MKNIKNEEAVSPVIGVILMVVITVIIAAVLAVFAFGIGSPEKPAPNAALKIESAIPTTVTIVHGGGDPILNDAANVKVSVDDATPTTVSYSTAEMGSATFFDPGESMIITPSTTLVSGEVVRVKIVDLESGKPILDATARVT